MIRAGYKNAEIGRQLITKNNVLEQASTPAPLYRSADFSAVKKRSKMRCKRLVF